jgi:hypothetical protein
MVTANPQRDKGDPSNAGQRNRAQMNSLEPAHRRLLHRRRDVCVGVSRDSDSRVSERLGHGLEIAPLSSMRVAYECRGS